MSEWIPIKETLPDLGACIIVTVREHFRGRNELRYPVYFLQNPDRQGYGFYVGGIDNQLFKEVSEVIAWMPMPEAFDGVY